MVTMINAPAHCAYQWQPNTLITPQVKGEVYLVDEAMLSQLDILEDHPTYYRSILTISYDTLHFHSNIVDKEDKV